MYIHIYWSMIKQDIICTCKENVDTKKKYIYMRDIHTQEGKFLLRTLLSFITYNRKMHDRNVFIFYPSLFVLFHYITLYFDVWMFLRWNVHDGVPSDTWYNNLRFKLDYHLNVFVKMDAHERMINEDKLSLLKFQRCVHHRECKQNGLLTFGFTFRLIKVRRHIKEDSEEIYPYIFSARLLFIRSIHL